MMRDLNVKSKLSMELLAFPPTLISIFFLLVHAVEQRCMFCFAAKTKRLTLFSYAVLPLLKELRRSLPVLKSYT